VLFKVIKEVPWVLTVLVVTIEHTCINHVIRMVTEEIISKNNVLKSRVVGRIALWSPNEEVPETPRKPQRLREQQEARVQNSSGWQDLTTINKTTMIYVSGRTP
jgi:hypothetical protein